MRCFEKRNMATMFNSVQNKYREKQYKKKKYKKDQPKKQPQNYTYFNH